MCLDSANQGSTEVRELARAENKWEGKRIFEYKINFVKNCHCPPPFEYVIRVASGGAVEFTDLAADTPITMAMIDSSAPSSVEDAFLWIRNALAGDQDITVTYDSAYGYPARIQINDVVEPTAYTFSNLEILRQFLID
jgi:hypothetical protein